MCKRCSVCRMMYKVGGNKNKRLLGEDKDEQWQKNKTLSSRGCDDVICICVLSCVSLSYPCMSCHAGRSRLPAEEGLQLHGSRGRGPCGWRLGAWPPRASVPCGQPRMRFRMSQWCASATKTTPHSALILESYNV
jgi:hypothetical protein